MASRAATARSVAVLVGLVLAVVAAYLVWQYVSAADQRAQEGAELVDVFVAAGGIPEGTTSQAAVTQGLVEPDQIPRANRPAGAVTTLQEISNLAAKAAIGSGAILQLGQWAEPTLLTGNVVVEEGRVGISLQVSVPEGASGYLSLEDRVAVLAHIEAPALTTSTEVDEDGNEVQTTQQIESTETRTQFIASGAEVLAVGRRLVSTDAQGNEDETVQQTEQVLVTLSVTPDEAERLVFANYEGLLYAVIQPEGELPETAGRTFDNLFAP